MDFRPDVLNRALYQMKWTLVRLVRLLFWLTEKHMTPPVGKHSTRGLVGTKVPSGNWTPALKASALLSNVRAIMVPSVSLLLLLLLLSSSSSSPLCRVFILIFLRQTMSLGNTVLNLLYFYISTFRSMCAVPNMAVFYSSLTSFSPVCCSRIFWMTLKIVPVAPYYYRYHLCFYIPHALYFCCKVFMFWNLRGFFFSHISVSWDCNIHPTRNVHVAPTNTLAIPQAFQWVLLSN